MKPLEMLTTELNILKRCKSKSIGSYERKEITKELHKTHLSNLNELINEFETVIKTIKDARIK